MVGKLEIRSKLVTQEKKGRKEEGPTDGGKELFPWPKELQRGVKTSKKEDGVCPNIRGHQRIGLPRQCWVEGCMYLGNLLKEVTMCFGSKGGSPAQKSPPGVQARTLLWKLGRSGRHAQGSLITALCRPDRGSGVYHASGRGRLGRLRGPRESPNHQPFVLVYFKRTSSNRTSN